MKKGNLIRLSCGRFATVVRGDYSFRFMEREDYEMVDAGMGHLAGLYGSAFDVIFSDSGHVARMRVGQRNYTVLADERLATHDIEEMTLAFADH
jgi:hypothetical protein